MRMTHSLAGVLLALSSPFTFAAAGDWRPDGVYVQAGPTERGAQVLQLGLAWDTPWRWSWGSWQVAPRGEVLVGAWRAENFNGGHQTFRQLALLPMWRLGPKDASYFLEFGIGANVLNRYYRTPDIITVTRWAFLDVAGAGLRFGPAGEHEVGVRLAHVSNGGLKQPNPGENFLLLRYERHF